MFYFCIPSKFQILNFAPDPNVPLSASEGKLDLYSANGNHRSLDVPSGSGDYWKIGTFKGTDGLDGISISSAIVSQFDKNTLC